MIVPTSPDPGHPEPAVHQIVAAHARWTPEATAVVCGAERLTYAELDTAAGRLATHLAGAGVTPGSVVAICLDRGVNLPVAILAALRAGAAYALLAPASPDAELRGRIGALTPAVVLTQQRHRVRVADAGAARVVCLDTDHLTIVEEPVLPVPSQVEPERIACVFHTSGTTGRAKLARIEHRNLNHAWRAWRDTYRIEPADRVLQTASVEFDVFTGDWIRALCGGATLVIAGWEALSGPEMEAAALVDLVHSERITVLECNVHLARRLLDHLGATGRRLESVRLFTVGADRWYLDEHLAARQLLGPGARVLNVYGVAEATIDSCYFDPADLPELPARPGLVSIVGRPFPGTEIRVCDPAGASVPRGMVGEIHIGGGGVPGDAPGRPQVWHRTGDLGRLRLDGLLEYVGRADSGLAGLSATAVAEIEAYLRDRPEVREAVLERADPPTGAGRRSGPLVGWVVAAPGATVDPTEVVAAVASERPGLTPGTVIVLPALPRTRSGAVDRGRLPRPPAAGAHGGKGTLGAAGKGAAGGAAATGSADGCLAVVIAVPVTLVSLLLTSTFWPGSTDTSRVPSPWAGLFHVLYICESLSFGAGVAVLLIGYPRLATLGRSRALTLLAHLSIVWLLVAWWPQDNLYRLTAPTNWPRQAAMVFGFNVTLMAAAAVVAWFARAQPPDPAGGPGAGGPGAGGPGADRSGADQLGVDRSGADGSGADGPGAELSGMDRPGAGGPGAGGPGAGGPGADRPAGAGSGGSRTSGERP